MVEVVGASSGDLTLTGTTPAIPPVWVMPQGAPITLRNKMWLDYQNDVKVSDDQLAAAAGALETVRAALDATQALVLAELHTRGCTDRDHGLRTGPWLAREAHLPVPAARARVKVAAVLVTWFPEVLQALTAGHISWEHAAVIARAANVRIAAQLAELQSHLLDAADATVFERWRLEVIGLADQLDPDGGHDPNLSLINI